MATITTNKDFEIALAADGTYCVVVRAPGELPVTIDGFANRQEAEEWVFEQQEDTDTDNILPSHL